MVQYYKIQIEKNANLPYFCVEVILNLKYNPCNVQLIVFNIRNLLGLKLPFIWYITCLYIHVNFSIFNPFIWLNLWDSGSKIKFKHQKSIQLEITFNLRYYKAIYIWYWSFLYFDPFALSAILDLGLNE